MDKQLQSPFPAVRTSLLTIQPVDCASYRFGTGNMQRIKCTGEGVRCARGRAIRHLTVLHALRTGDLQQFLHILPEDIPASCGRCGLHDGSGSCIDVFRRLHRRRLTQKFTSQQTQFIDCCRWLRHAGQQSWKTAVQIMQCAPGDHTLLERYFELTDRSIFKSLHQ